MSDLPFLRLHAHDEIRERLRRAVSQGRLPHSLLFHGPRGVGKQRLALWTAATLQCSDEEHRPCGRCRACRLAGRLEHPDIHWFFPLARPHRASSPERLREQLEEARAEVLAERRADPIYLEDREKTTGIYVDIVRSIRRVAQAAPAMGPYKALVVGHAEAMIPQKGSAQAANALLKLLEEPPADTFVILTANVPGALLPTVRSRVQAIRVPPLSGGAVADFLETALELPRPEAQRLDGLSGGSIGRALELAQAEDEGVRPAALMLVQAGLDERARVHYLAAHAQAPTGARGAFSEVLNAASDLARDLLAACVGASDAVSQTDAVERLSKRYDPDPDRLLALLDAFDEARDFADVNVNPQLITGHLLRRLANGPKGRVARQGRT